MLDDCYCKLLESCANTSICSQKFHEGPWPWHCRRPRSRFGKCLRGLRWSLPPCLTYTTTVATTTRRLVTWTLSRQKMRFVKLTTIHYETAFAALQTCVPEEIRDLVLANFYRALLLYSYCYFW